MYLKLFLELSLIKKLLITTGAILIIIFLFVGPVKAWKKLSCAAGFSKCLWFAGSKFHPEDVIDIGFLCDDRNYYSSEFVLVSLEKKIGFRANYKPKNYKRTANISTSEHNNILNRHFKREIATICRSFDHASRQGYNWSK